MGGAALQGVGAVAGGLRLHERDEAAVRSVRVLHHRDSELVDPAQLLRHRMQSLLRRHPPDAAQGAWCEQRLQHAGARRCLGIRAAHMHGVWCRGAGIPVSRGSSCTSVGLNSANSAAYGLAYLEAT